MGNDTRIVQERRFFIKGAMVFEEGEVGSSAFLIQSGRVSVFTEKDGARVDLATLEAGQIFGEMALLLDGKRLASVEALTDCSLIVITRQVLEHKLENSDPTVKAIVNMLSQRVLSSNDVVADKQSDAQDLTSIASVIYQNIFNSLPVSKRRDFQSSVLPKLNAFFDAMRAFQKRNN